MFISTLDLFKIGIGPSSSHTLGPMFAAAKFLTTLSTAGWQTGTITCTVKGSLAHTGRGHATDTAILLGLHGRDPLSLGDVDINALSAKLATQPTVTGPTGDQFVFSFPDNVFFDRKDKALTHPNTMVFELAIDGVIVCSETMFSIGGGFVATPTQLGELVAPLQMSETNQTTYAFDSAASMLAMAEESGLTIAAMKRQNELDCSDDLSLDKGLDAIWKAMSQCIEAGLSSEGTLPGGLQIRRRAKSLHESSSVGRTELVDRLCAYAMAVNEENAAGHRVVTAPTNGAAGVIPAVLYHAVQTEDLTDAQIRDFLLTAAAIGGLIKHRSSISGAEVGCQGEVGSASAMAAAGLCHLWGGTPRQVEEAAEIALEHHLGMTCDPVGGLVQVPCIERNGFGAVKAYTAASLACKGTGDHFISLDSCIEAMKQTGIEMSEKYKETSLGGLAVTITEC